MSAPGLLRRRLLGSLAIPLLPGLPGCAPLLPPLANPATAPDAQALLDRSAAAHGLAALTAIRDVNVSYAGHWRGLVNTIQPALVDAQYRGVSEERLLLASRLTAQTHTGPDGRKQVVRQAAPQARGDIRVWLNGTPSTDRDRLDAAAIVADAYGLFLLGPMLLASYWAAERALVMEVGAPARITVGGAEYGCDVLRMSMAPGLGRSASDQLALYIDRGEHLMRRVRFTLDGLDSTRGAVAEVDVFDHVTLHGVRWPTGFHERLLRPLPLPVHDWRLTGLDVNRGLTAADLAGPAFTGAAAAPARPLTATATPRAAGPDPQ